MVQHSMTLQESLEKIKNQYDVLGIIDLDRGHDMPEFAFKYWLKEQLDTLHRDVYETNQRIVVTQIRGDIYNDKDVEIGLLLSQLQKRLNEVDISNFFVILLTNDTTQELAYQQHYQSISSDPIPILIMVFDNVITEKQIKPPSKYDYDDRAPIKIDKESLTDKQNHLLIKSKVFCMYPWIHLHAYPTGETYPCCIADMQFPIGNCKKNTFREIWNQAPLREIRRSMLNDQPVSACTRCYEQEASGFISGRISANKHHGHHIDLINQTQADGTLDEFRMTYWDIRFSNLCNLKCRSCGHIFSSQWYQDQAQISGPEWKANNQVLNYAGRYETDAWEQLLEHIDYVEQIYFAGGEPLLMDEHYKILEELERRKKFDVRLIYNSNFTHTNLKDRSVFDYWKKFDSVSVGASLDASGARGEYIRKGTIWEEVEENRRNMIEICPEVDFYVSSTLSILNAWHLSEFHQDWVNRGLIRAQDFNVNILQDPPYYRIDVAPMKYKQRLRIKWEEHLLWLAEQTDPLKRATRGWQSAIRFMMGDDKSNLLEKFWQKTNQLDLIRKENLLVAIPELEALK